jgi:isoquinoline 1-oxidoreductase beta subunit
MTPEFEGIVFQGITRRAFLVSSGAAAVAVAFGSLGGAKRAMAQGKQLSPNAWVSVGTDNVVTIISPASEMGQGVKTSNPLLLAEEMDLDWSKVRVDQAPHNPKAFGNPLFGGAMVAGASRTTRGYYEVIRLAGMQARQVMIIAAAGKWGVPADQCTTEPHTVVHKPSGRKMTYGEIAAFAEVPANVPQFTREQLKPASQFRLVGKDVPRVDIPDKVVGKAQYGMDVRMPGMMYAAVVGAPVHGEKPEQVDDSQARKVPGVKQIVRMPWGVGVIAETYPAAKKAKEALKVTWSKQSKGRAYTTEKIVEEYRQRARNLSDSGVVYEQHGDAKGAMAKAAKRVVGEYVTVNLTHMQMEPINCTALVVGDSIEFWAPTQAPTLVWLAAVKGLGFDPGKVKVNTTYLGGGFGRRAENDYAFDAGFLAKAMPGVPIKVIWSREDDVLRTKTRPLVFQRIEAGLDGQGNIVAWHHRIVAESIYARFAPPAFQKAGGRDITVCEGAVEVDYSFPNFETDYLREQRGIDVAVWRGVGSGHNKFAIEQFIEEVAQAAGKDPVDLRLQLLSKQPRARAVIEEVMRMSEYRKPRKGRALGFAYADAWETKIAMVTEVSVDRKTGKPRVHEIWAAIDPGVPIQPGNIQRQVESNIAWGIGATREKLMIKNGEPQASNFHNYPVLRMAEMPKVTTKVMAGGGKIGGMGEVGLPPVAPAIANAVFKLTGKRLRELPFNEALLKA